MISCQKISKLLLSDQLETQSWRQRVEVHLHFAMCQFCSRLGRQMEQLRSGARQMRDRGEADKGLEERLNRRLFRR